MSESTSAPNPGAEGKGLLRGSLWIKHMSSVYSPAQVRQWLAKIGYLGDLDSFVPSLASLTHLARLSLATFPFENTAMHYTENHSMDITYEGLFERMVASSGGHGSYCFGLNGLFFQMLRGLGFRIYAGAGRINEQPAGAPPVFHAFVHMILFVQPEAQRNTTYLVDVAAGPVRPILLEEGTLVEGPSPASEKHALTRVARAESSLASAPDAQIPLKLEWRLETVHTNSKDPTQPPSRRVMYAFLEDEFFDADFRAANYGVLGLRAGLFWENVVCAKWFWMSDREVRGVDADRVKVDLVDVDGAAHGEHKVVSRANGPPLDPLTRYLGRIAMAGAAVRQHVGAHTTVLRVMKSEVDRAEALEEFFGIRIPRGDLGYIRGRGAELGV